MGKVEFRGADFHGETPLVRRTAVRRESSIATHAKVYIKQFPVVAAGISVESTQVRSPWHRALAISWDVQFVISYFPSTVSDSQAMDSENMPKLDFKKDAKRLKSTDLILMRRVEEDNIRRATRVKDWRKSNNRFAIPLAFGALGIYLYTMYAIKQETFLDDFEEPEKILEKST
ncbi:hypothetical protein KM043_018056 [Ampulex compressa]|nr:hypothetical protein KM043_018056 [Ampulex compressa]